MANSYPNDVLYSPEDVQTLLVPSIRATALASQLTVGERINLTDYNQNYASSMFPVPMAQKWSGNELRQPNVTTATPNFPKPSAVAEFFRNRLVQIQDILVGTP